MDSYRRWTSQDNRSMRCRTTSSFSKKTISLLMPSEMGFHRCRRTTPSAKPLKYRKPRIHQSIQIGFFNLFELASKGFQYYNEKLTVKIVITDLAWLFRFLNNLSKEPSVVANMAITIGTRTPVWDLMKFKENIRKSIQNDKVSGFSLSKLYSSLTTFRFQDWWFRAISVWTKHYWTSQRRS